MAAIEFVGQSAQSQTSPGAGTSRLLNLYREPVTEGDSTRYVLRPVPGQTALHTPDTEFQRAMSWVSGDVYTVSGGFLSVLGGDGAPSQLGAVADDENTSIAGNLSNIGVVAGSNYYLWNGTTVSEPTSGAFSSFGSIESVGQRIMLTELGGRRFQWSDVADPTTLGGLNFATTEAGEDVNIRGVALSGNYWIFKERSIEIWYQTGSADQAEAFARVSGGVITTGLKSFNLITKIRGGLFFIGNDNAPVLTTGAGLEYIGSAGVIRSIKDNNPTHCFYFEHEGHKFCVIRFGDRPAWVYNFSSKEWSERSEGHDHGPWDAVATTQRTAGDWIAAGELGSISQLSNVQHDKGGPLYRRAISRTLWQDAKRFRVPELEFLADMGRVATDEELAAVMRTSGNKGNTWSTGRQMSLGAQGRYENRVLFRSLGQFRNLTIRLDITHGYEVPLFSTANLRLA